jgi:hypothetical protein
MMIDFPVHRGVLVGTQVSIYENSVDTSPPRYKNRHTRCVAQLDVDIERVGLRRKLFSSKKRQIGGHWYYSFRAYVEAMYGSAWVEYTLKLKGTVPDVSLNQYWKNDN